MAVGDAPSYAELEREVARLRRALAESRVDKAGAPCRGLRDVPRAGAGQRVAASTRPGTRNFGDWLTNASGLS